MVETFCPTVGTVFCAVGGAEGLKSDLMLERRVVLPALSSPRRRMEYSVQFQTLVFAYRSSLGCGTFSTGCVSVNSLS